MKTLLRGLFLLCGLLLLSGAAHAQNGCGQTRNWTDPLCQQIASGALKPDWSVISRHGEYSQNESECNTPGSVSVANSLLTITTTAVNYTCGDFNVNGTVRTSAASWPFSTGDIQWNTLNFTFGTVTIRGRVPAQNTSTWPAFWLLGTNCQNTNKYSGDTGFSTCPNIGAAAYTEIDMVECYDGGWCQFHVANGTSGFGTGCDTQWTVDTNTHTFQTVWTPTNIKQFMDGVQEFSCNQAMSNPMFLLMQIQTGGVGGTPANLPATMQVDWVQVQDVNGNIIFYDSFDAPPPPSITFTDLLDGPNTGGENNNGTILTIYGKNFGPVQGTGTVTVGGGAVAQYYQWGVAAPGELGLQKIVVGLGSSAVTGTVVVNTSFGASVCENPSENCQFTVRSGNIRCVSTTGNDGNPGTFPSSCWRTMTQAAHTIAAGDIAYIENGVVQSSLDNFSAMLWLGDSGSGTAGHPKALVGYPGAVAQIGLCTAADQGFGIRGSIFHAANDYWTIANLKACSTGRAIGGDGINNWRAIGNDLSCPQGSGSQGCFEPDSANFWKVYGNYMHDTGTNTKFYHGIYFSTDDNHIDLGWNTVARIAGCRGIQFHSSPVSGSTGFNEFDLLVHDNIVHDVRCDGINMATIDPSQGQVTLYNNLVYHVGTGPVPSDGGGNFSCLYFSDVTNNGPVGTGTVQTYNNTLYDCGSVTGVGANQLGSINKGGSSPAMFITLTNNIIDNLSGQSYVSSSSGGGTAQLNGTNNVWFGNGAAPSQTTGNVTTDPQFVSTTAHNFHFAASTSPAVGTGSTLHKSTYDLDNLIRPSPPSIGAYEFSAGVQAPAPIVSLAPTSLSYGSQTVNTTSAAQTTTLTNIGTATLTFTSITFTGTNAGDFAISNNTCGASLGVGLNCAVSVTFRPTASGARAANLTFTTNASSSPDNVALTGTGTGSATSSYAPTSQSYLAIKLGLNSGLQTTVLTNTGSATMTITSIALTGANLADFGLTTTCGATLGAGLSCNINVAFIPRALGLRVANVTVTSNATSSPDNIPLSGTAFLPISGNGTATGSGVILSQP